MADWGDAAIAAIPVATALIGEAAASGDDARAEQLRQQAMNEFNIELPPIRQMAAQFIESKGATASNPVAKASRMDALRLLGERSSEGYNAEDRAAVNDLMSEVSQRERGSRMAITQGMDPNSGAAIAAQLSNQQASAQRANQQGVALAGQSRANALRALNAQGQLAGDIENDELRRGQMADSMAQFNERNRMDAGRWNAQQEQNRFNSRLDLSAGRTGQLGGMANAATAAGNRKRQIGADTGKAIQKGVYGYQTMQAKKKGK